MWFDDHLLNGGDDVTEEWGNADTISKNYKIIVASIGGKSENCMHEMNSSAF